MGLLKFTPKGWSAAVGLRISLSSKEQDSMHMTGMLNGLIQNKILSVDAVANTGSWGEIDNQEDLNLYSRQ